MARPESKNVFYFPHYTKSSRELDLIVHRHKAEGFMAYYKLLELIADADYHYLSLKTEDEKDMFDLGMNCDKRVVDDVIRILVNRGRINREIWENNQAIWMQDFVNTLNPVYVNRKKKLPNIEYISTSNNLVSNSRNPQKRKEN